MSVYTKDSLDKDTDFDDKTRDFVWGTRIEEV